MTEPSKSRLQHQIDKIATAHGMDKDVLRSVLGDFVAALHENKVKGWRQEDGIVGQTYWVLGDEATYHLFGFLTRTCPGDNASDFLVELEYMDPRLKRFYSTVERWEKERDWEIEDSK